MRIFITGGSGFIGKATVKVFLNSGFKVMMLSRNFEENITKRDNLEIIKGDLENIDLVKNEVENFSPDCIIHLAWEGIPDYSYIMSKINLNNSLKILEFCDKIKCKSIVMTGSCWEYKEKTGPIYENDLVSADNGFKSAKNALRFLTEGFCKEKNIDYYWIRPFFVYGKNQKNSSLIPYIINSIKNGYQPELNGAYNKNDFIYVDDVGEAIKSILIEKPKEKIINIGTGRAVKVLDILGIVAYELNFKIDCSKYNKTETNTNFWANVDILKNGTKWEPKFDIRDGILEILKY